MSANKLWLLMLKSLKIKLQRLPAGVDGNNKYFSEKYKQPLRKAAENKNGGRDKAR
jgi:hypothetical protein